MEVIYAFYIPLPKNYHSLDLLLLCIIFLCRYRIDLSGPSITILLYSSYSIHFYWVSLFRLVFQQLCVNVSPLGSHPSWAPWSLVPFIAFAAFLVKLLPRCPGSGEVSASSWQRMTLSDQSILLQISFNITFHKTLFGHIGSHYGLVLWFRFCVEYSANFVFWNFRKPHSVKMWYVIWGICHIKNFFWNQPDKHL